MLCGGPAGYLVFSRQVSDETRLRDLVARYTELERQLNESAQTSGICIVVPQPNIALIAGRCQATVNSSAQ